MRVLLPGRRGLGLGTATSTEPSAVAPTLVPSLAVDSSGRQCDQSGTPRSRRSSREPRPLHVDSPVALGLVHGLCRTGFSSQMNDDIEPRQCVPRACLTDVCDDDLPRKALHGSFCMLVHLGIQTVDGDQFMLRGQHDGDMLTDESGPAGDENAHGALRRDPLLRATLTPRHDGRQNMTPPVTCP